MDSDESLLQEALDELEEHEWEHDNYMGQESNVCRSCGVSAKGCAIPEGHDPDCSWHRIVEKLRARLGTSG